MKLNSSDVSFGRHESFALRFGWLTKGLSALIHDPKVFERDDATVVLGVGKNMVSAIRYWLQATQIVARNDKRFLELTSVGEIVFANGGDPYLEDEATLWLLHWLLATNSTGATAIYWFFNHFHKPEFKSEEVTSGLRDFVKQHIDANVSAATLKNDASLLLRMYVSASGNSRVALEDALDSPLSLLRLQERVDARTFRGIPMERNEIPVPIFAYAIAEMFEILRVEELTVQQLMYSDGGRCAPGAVYRMTENGLIRKLEQLCAAMPESLALNDTAGVHQLYRLKPFASREVLEDYYVSDGRRELAA